MRNRANYRDVIVGRLTVGVERIYVPPRAHRYWNCKCACGNRTVVRQDSLATGNTRSCGCKRKQTPLPTENHT